MGKPAKIKKKKSFMFTSKHHSFLGILGIVVACISLLILSFGVAYGFRVRGQVEETYGFLGFFSAFLNIIGIICGFRGLRERDIFKIAPWTAVGMNGVVLVIWGVLVLLALR